MAAVLAAVLHEPRSACLTFYVVVRDAPIAEALEGALPEGRADDRGQEDVTWKDWRALAGACEEHGIEALFRSDHYLWVLGKRRARLAGRVGHPAALRRRDQTLRLGDARLPRHLPAPSELAKFVTTSTTSPAEAAWSSASAPAGTRPSTGRTLPSGDRRAMDRSRSSSS